MKKLLLTLFVPFLFISANGQNSYTIEGKNLKAAIHKGGNLFYNPDNFNSLFEIPKNSGKSTIFNGQLWIGGIDSASGQIVASAQTYRQSTRAWHEGPIADNFNGNYDRVYFGTNSEVQSHQSNFLNPSYTIPQNFLDWPSAGDINNGEPAELAPFIDFNQNGIYDPANGDHPKIRGNSAVYSIFNDVRDTIPFQGNPCCFGFDVESYVYDLSYADPNLENTLFLNYKITNRSSRTYQDVFISMWMDTDIGDASDDYIGCDSANSMFFAYNADNYDDTLNNGYGTNPPAQGFIFLSHPMSKFISYNNNFDSVNGNPTSDIDYYNYTRGIWKDGSNLSLGEDGTNQNNPPTSFMYSGNGWTEEEAGMVPSDRRGLGSIGPFSLAPGEELSFDFALLYFRDSTVDNFANRDSLLNRSVAISNYYQSRILSISDANNSNDLKVYPNPASNILNISTSSTMNEDIIFKAVSLSGETFDIPVLNQSESNAVLNISDLQKGIYILRIQGANELITQKIIVE